MNIKIGIGKYDITGPSAEVTFMGMSKLSQRGKGIHSRLFSRAYVIEDLDNGKSVVLVVADMGMCFQALQQAVIKKLRNYKPFKVNGKYIYSEKNVLISGNHTHSGPGGYSNYFVYNLAMIDLHAMSGFNGQNFDCIADGIFRSIVDAHLNKRKGKILMAKGDLEDCGKIRSVPAYKNNPEIDETAIDPDNTVEPFYREMTLLKFLDENNEPMGSLNWFALHPTNMGEKNRLISGDNKGYAEELMEKRYKGVISAFANSCCGDISPNVGFGRPDGVHDFQRCKAFGTKQFQKAVELFKDKSAEELTGGIDYRQTFVDMSHCAIEGTDKRTWPAAFGLAMTKGSMEDSLGPGRWPEGTRKPEYFKDPEEELTLERFIVGLLGIKWPKDIPQDYVDGHGNKPIFIHLGLSKYKGHPLVPNILPLQMITLGNLVIIAHPGEMTTVAGCRLRNTVRDVLDEASTGIKHAVVATYSGAFSSYTTTREEYDMQHYEGASTLFGPWTLDAYLQENKKLALAIKEDKTVPRGPTPPNLSQLYRQRITGVRPEQEPPGSKFGDVEGHQPGGPFRKGDTVEISFWGGNPNNDLKTGDSYLEIQKKFNGHWRTVYTDREYCTIFHWKRRNPSSVVTIEWMIPEETKAGTYRICYSGHWKYAPKHLIKINSQSDEFAVE
jgi:neutral ceramidase